MKFKFKTNIQFEEIRFKRFSNIFKIKNNKRYLKNFFFLFINIIITIIKILF